MPAPTISAGAPCWIDLFSSATDRATAFYGDLLGWRAELPEEGFGGYFVFTKDGEVVAGCMANDGSAGMPDTWSVYLATDDAAKTMLGAAQKAWLKRELKASRAPFKILAAGGGWSSAENEDGGDSWGVFLTERNEMFDFIRDVLLKNHPTRASAATIAERLAFLGKFQQVTPPAMAKGIEDTAFYRFNRLISLNEVGGEPEAPGTSVDEFHALNKERSAARLNSLLATSTHDTKRSEDVRVRIDAISEIVEEWSRAVTDWWDRNAPLRKLVASPGQPELRT